MLSTEQPLQQPVGDRLRTSHTLANSYSTVLTTSAAASQLLCSSSAASTPSAAVSFDRNTNSLNSAMLPSTAGTSTTTASAMMNHTSARLFACSRCQEVIQDSHLLEADNRYWHEDCLRCHCCDCRLGEVGSSLFTRANLLLCKRDYLRMFGSSGYCAVCSKTIPAFELVMRARDNVYHLECFACQHCSYRFCVGDKFYLVDNLIMCEEDYDEYNNCSSPPDAKKSALHSNQVPSMDSTASPSSASTAASHSQQSGLSSHNNTMEGHFSGASSQWSLQQQQQQQHQQQQQLCMEKKCHSNGSGNNASSKAQKNHCGADRNTRLFLMLHKTPSQPSSGPGGAALTTALQPQQPPPPGGKDDSSSGYGTPSPPAVNNNNNNNKLPTYSLQ